MKKILVVEDDLDLFTLLKYNLEKESYTLTGSQTGRNAVELCRREAPDLVLLDIMLPDCDGLEICRGIRATPGISHVPIIFLSARSSETDRIVGLEVGGNDYVTKPFSMRELVARIKIQFRVPAGPPVTLKSGPVELDRLGHRVRNGGLDVQLTSTEFRLLDFLMSRAGTVFSRDQLLDALWGDDRTVTDRTVDVYVLRLRQKLEANPSDPVLIRSVRGFGYSFEASNG